MRKPCQAHVQSTKNVCQKPALAGSRYCYLHHPKGSTIVGSIIFLVLGAILSPVAQSAWDQSFPKKQKSPNLKVFVDNLPVQHQSTVVLPTTNDVRQVSFSLINVGDGSAENVEIAVSFPERINVIKHDGWTESSSVASIESGIQKGKSSSFYSLANGVVHSSNILDFRPLTVQHTNLTRTENGTTVLISGKDIPYSYMNVWLKFTNGVGNAYLDKKGN